MQESLTLLEMSKAKLLQELEQILRIPSISALPEYKEDMLRMVEWLRVHCMEIGLENVSIIETDGHPVLYGEKILNLQWPTILIYGHYDVQPADPVEQWKSQPFEPEIKENYIYARGSSDDKAQFFANMKAVQFALQADKKPQINIKLVLEGEEEEGSVHFESFVEKHMELLACDCVLVSDGAMVAADQPLIVTALRGLVYFELTLQTADKDLHSGLYGGGVANAATILSQVLSSLKGENEQILISGIYQDVEEICKNELKQMYADKQSFEKTAQSFQYVHEQGFQSHLMPKLRPSLDINGMVSGFTGTGAKTVIPNTAQAKFSIRLVADQKAEQVVKQTKKYIKKLFPKNIKYDLQVHSMADPVRVSIDNQFVTAASKTLEHVFGHRPKFTRIGGTIAAVEILQRLVKADTLLMGYGLPDDGLHSPNERFYLPNFYKGIENTLRFFYEVGKNESGVKN